MEIQEKIYSLSDRIKQLKDQIQTEEATKQSFILPFFQMLGYDVFNPLEFVPEFIADVGIKKGEKVDYAILQDNKPFILIEAKPCFDILSKHENQLIRYFTATECKFAILTNGIVYKFYTDLDNPNKMDSKPFFILDLLNLNDQDIVYLENFIKANLNVENIMGTAEELKYLSLIKNAFKEVIEDPKDDFIKLFITPIYDGIKTQAIVDKFRPIVKKAINQFINDRMSAKFKETLTSTDSSIENEITEKNEPVSKIVTTIDELNGYAIVKSILRNTVEAKRIVYKDTESYFNILLDNNIRKWICRLKLGTKTNSLIIPDENKKEIRFPIETLDNIYDYSDKLIEVLNRYIA